ncbi:MAG: hypothetical protein ACM339_11500 [Ignavibacteria bacterium]
MSGKPAVLSDLLSLFLCYRGIKIIESMAKYYKKIIKQVNIFLSPSIIIIVQFDEK